MLEWSRWEPFRDFPVMRSAMDRLLGDVGFVRDSGLWSGVRVLPLDLYETPDHLIVKTYIPGARPEDVDVTVEKGVITLRGTIHSEAEQEQARDWTWHVRELGYGAFARSIALPTSADPDKAEATFENGILTLRVPKAGAAKPRQITVHTPMLAGSR